ncbi:ferredoxin reductase family protein [Streptacidiphilus sp. PB12-B1b]|uniref:ferredoxin reductase family protein n=1 Tax=Streptacidiphilus sp. PB12-B1b TaxID=2705012 RepID=UPI0015FA8026|nr:ferredoxin reductase family protein [Streptacidiphilus sp. PB12-B1b]QMU75881.1 ferredoxin reductase family protein [Streptacidiphilus sp. PB12-B1b]
MTSTVATRTAADPGPSLRHADTAARALLGVIGAGAAAVLWLWWSDTGAIIGAGQWITNGARLCGLLAGYTAPVLVLLMARIPAADRTLGTDRLARWHAMGGRYMVGLVIAHVTLIIWGYSLTDDSGVVHQTAQIVFHYPDMLKAVCGTLLLFAVAAVSARAARRRLRYETWYHLHLATYLAIVLVFFHQLSNGDEFLRDPAARAAWYCLYLGAAAAIGWFRFVLPARDALRHRLRVAEVRTEAPGVVSVLVTGRRLDELAARTRPGQFFRWRFLAPGLAWSANPYSLSAPPGGGPLRITVRERGGHSAALRTLRPGTRVVAEGPYGAFTADRRSAPKVLLLAAGVGITPLRTLFETVPAAPGGLTLLYRAGSEQDVLFRDELEAVAAARGARLHYLVGARAEIGEPLQTRTLLGLLPDLRDHDVYLCGPAGMVATAREALDTAGVPPRRIHHESFEF